MLKYTANNLTKIETVFKQRNYVIRYEKGNFNSGYCLLEDKRVIVVNKYFDIEAKINCLMDIFQEIDLSPEDLTEAERNVLKHFEQKLNV